MQKMKNLLTSPTNELSKWSRFLVLQVRIWFHCLRLLKVNRCGTQAAALSYHSLFGLVPLVIVGLMIFQLFPANKDMADKVKNVIYDQMNLTHIQYPAEEDKALVESANKPDTPTEVSPTDSEDIKEISVADKLDELISRYLSKLHTGAITVVGAVLVIWAAIGLLTTIERSFNSIFHVGTGRGFLHRLFNYWALLTLGPILLGLAIYVSTQHLLTTGLAQGLFTRVAPVIPFSISLLAFFLIYFFLPNTLVSAKAALWGAFVGTLLWTAAKFGLRIYMSKVIMYQAVYGVLGIIPLTVFWIYVSWLIVLFGLQLTYATQNIKRLDAAEFSKARRQEQCFLANDQTVIRVMEYVLNAFERKDQEPVSVEVVSFRLGMPIDFTEKILDRLVQSGLLCHTSEPTVGYVPSTDGSHITLDEISRAISEVSFAQPSAADATNMRAVFDELLRHLSQYSLRQVLNKDEDFTTQTQAAPESPTDGSGQV
jgi:membrane protein